MSTTQIGTTIHDEAVEVVHMNADRFRVRCDGSWHGPATSEASALEIAARLVPAHRRPSFREASDPCPVCTDPTSMGEPCDDCWANRISV